MNIHLPAPIANLKSYNASLRTTLGDKLFFLDKVPVGEDMVFVDFGCADGSLLKELKANREMFSWKTALYYGVDRDPAQRDATWENFPEINGTFEGLAPVPLHEDRTSVLIVSSVLHELFSENLGRFFWSLVEKMGFDYIAVRDYALSPEVYQKPTPQWWVEEAMAQGYFNELRDMGVKYGSMLRLHNFMHFLLKYPYRENWARELEENYVPHSTWELWGLLTGSGKYVTTYIHETTTQHFKDRIERDFGITNAPTTHVEMVLKRRK